MHRIRYLQSLTTYITTAAVINLPFWRFDGFLDKLFIGGMVFTGMYYLLNRAIKKKSVQTGLQTIVRAFN